MRSNLELIERLYATVRTGDYSAFRELCSPDIEWRQNRECPGGGCWHGADEVIERVFKAITSEWERFGYVREQMLEAGGAIIVLGVYEGQHKRTGKNLRAASAHVFDVVDGKVARFRQVADAAMFQAARSA